jgi:hypothetical protein
VPLNQIFLTVSCLSDYTNDVQDVNFPVPLQISPPSPPWQEFYYSIVREIRLLHLKPFTNTLFSSVLWNRWLARCCFSCQTIAWVEQKFTVQGLQRWLCLTCAVWLCIVVLKEHTSWRFICLGCWSSTSVVADSTIIRKWKWLFVHSCECKMPILPRRDS